MSIFAGFTVEKKVTLKEKTEKVFGDCEKLLFDAMAASGLSISDIAEADSEEVALFHKYMKLMKDAEELAIDQAEQLDKIDNLEESLKEINGKIDALIKLNGSKEAKK